MAIQLNPYLSFGGDAREAMEFYHTVFGGELRISTFGEYHAAEPGSPDFDKVMHASLTTDFGLDFSAADNPPGTQPATGSRVSMAIMAGTADEDRARTFFVALAEGGTITQPLEKQVWGDVYGSITDRFGIEWMLNIGDQG